MGSRHRCGVSVSTAPRAHSRIVSSDMTVHCLNLLLLYILLFVTHLSIRSSGLLIYWWHIHIKHKCAFISHFLCSKKLSMKTLPSYFLISFSLLESVKDHPRPRQIKKIICAFTSFLLIKFNWVLPLRYTTAFYLKWRSCTKFMITSCKLARGMQKTSSFSWLNRSEMLYSLIS